MLSCDTNGGSIGPQDAYKTWREGALGLGVSEGQGGDHIFSPK